jgi:hypothetical protein
MHSSMRPGSALNARKKPQKRLTEPSRYDLSSGIITFSKASFSL